MDAFQSFSFVVAVFALLLSIISLLQSNTNSGELFLIRGRIEELENLLSEKAIIPDFLRTSGKWTNTSSCI